MTALEYVDVWLAEHARYSSDYDHRSRAIRAKRRLGMHISYWQDLCVPPGL